MMLKSATFVERRGGVVLNLLGWTALFVGSVAATTVVEDDGALVLLAFMALLLIGSQIKRLIRPHRLVLTPDGIVESGTLRTNRLTMTAWSEVGPVSTLGSDLVSFVESSGKSHNLHAYGVKSQILAALMNDLRLSHSEEETTWEAADRTLVSAGELYRFEDQPEVTRRIEPIDPSLAIPPEATGDFLVMARTPMDHRELQLSFGGHLTRASVDGNEQDVLFDFGQSQLIVIGFVADGDGSEVCAPVGADLANSFWAAYRACEGRLKTL